MSKQKDNISFLVAALKGGDERAFRTIYDNHVIMLKSFIKSYTKNAAQADDIVQDTFLKIWSIRESLDVKKSIKSLLFKTAYNLLIDKYRKKQREVTMLDAWMHRRLMDTIKEDETQEKEKLELVKTAIEKLPPRCKEVFVLSKFEQLKYKEIAERLNISVKTVEVQMGKAFKIIREEVYKNNSVLKLFLLFLKKTINKF